MTTGPRKRSSPRNEGKACDSVVRCLEHRMGETRAAIRRPETEGIGPRVDFHLMLGTREYAIEHTQIEAVPGFIRTGEGYAQLIKPVIADLSGTLPGPADYWLYFPLDTHLGVKKAELDRIRQGLIAWVRVKARRLYERNLNRLEREHKSPRYIDSIEANPPGFHYPVRLWVRPALSGSEDSWTRTLCSGQRGAGGSSCGPAAAGILPQMPEAPALQERWSPNRPGAGERRYRPHGSRCRRRTPRWSTGAARGSSGRDLSGGNRCGSLDRTLHEARHRMLAHGELGRTSRVPRGRPDRSESSHTKRT